MNQMIQEYKEQTHKEIIAQKAQEIVRSRKVTKVGVNHWRVQTSDNKKYPGLMYDVLFDTSLDILTCSCPHFTHRLEYCKHLLSVAMWEGDQ